MPNFIGIDVRHFGAMSVRFVLETIYNVFGVFFLRLKCIRTIE